MYFPFRSPRKTVGSQLLSAMGTKKTKGVQSPLSKTVYQSPLVIRTSIILLESNLLGDSIVHRSFIQTVGQRNNGYYEEGEIVSTTNEWFD